MTYDVSGNGEVLLLIPGLGGQASFWSAITPRLAENYQVVSFDHRGTGRSDRPNGEYTIARIAEDAYQILKDVGAASAGVIGHSTGGMIAQYLSLDHPELVNRLVISGSWEKPDGRFRTMFEARLGVLLGAGPKVYQRLTHAVGYPADYLDRNRIELEAVIEASPTALSPLEVASARIDMLFSDYRSDELASIKVPTLVIGATDDALIPFYHSQRLGAMIPGAQLTVLDGAHFFPKVHPERFATIVRQFLEYGYA
ncbi:MULTISPECIES: alpha/beta fold hydrolase [unclassified Rhizobium]|uniref:alpha/beta fold hydrolase n=1 Tax=unclassified Rhizobium TaxID=2613769 RepID=UPI0015CF21FC|nr:MULTISPECIES: alpha/beta fold hydrolase [unclassified Rhizobium]MDF0661651.1 alpha/beta fold hydrolase [Rhizobium sp. BC49]